MVKRLIYPICGLVRKRADFGRNATPTATPKRKGYALRTQPSDSYGAGTKSRTRDLLITNQLLYQLSYAGLN